jgi:hypothetical protein
MRLPDKLKRPRMGVRHHHDNPGSQCYCLGALDPEHAPQETDERGRKTRRCTFAICSARFACLDCAQPKKFTRPPTFSWRPVRYVRRPPTRGLGRGRDCPTSSIPSSAGLIIKRVVHRAGAATQRHRARVTGDRLHRDVPICPQCQCTLARLLCINDARWFALDRVLDASLDPTPRKQLRALPIEPIRAGGARSLFAGAGPQLARARRRRDQHPARGWHILVHRNTEPTAVSWFQLTGGFRASARLAALIQHSSGRPRVWRAGAMST